MLTPVTNLLPCGKCMNNKASSYFTSRVSQTYSCSWAIHFTLTVPLSTQVYKWVPENLMLGVVNPEKDQHPIQGEKKYQDKLQPGGPLGSYLDVTFLDTYSVTEDGPRPIVSIFWWTPGGSSLKSDKLSTLLWRKKCQSQIVIIGIDLLVMIRTVIKFWFTWGALYHHICDKLVTLHVWVNCINNIQVHP